jgi:hypothetical protein
MIPRDAHDRRRARKLHHHHAFALQVFMQSSAMQAHDQVPFLTRYARKSITADRSLGSFGNYLLFYFADQIPVLERLRQDPEQLSAEV